MEKSEAKILIVDDEEHFRTILSSIMEEEGFKVLGGPRWGYGTPDDSR